MKRNHPVLHFLFAIFAFGLLTGCKTTTGVATQDRGESAKTVMVSTFAGSRKDFADGVGGDARFYRPTDIASDAAGNLYVADNWNHRIRKITPAGEVSTFAGGEKGFADGIGGTAKFRFAHGIASDAAGNLYVADIGNNRIRKITLAGEVGTLAGGESGFADGIGSDARFNQPSDIASDAAGNLYVADTWNHRIRKVTPTGDVSTFAGGVRGFADGIGGDAEFFFPHGIASDAAGHLYVADSGNHRIRKITPAGEVGTLAGSEKGFADGIGSDARFNRPYGIAADAAGNLYVADYGNQRIRKITPTGKVSTLAGGEEGFADGVGGDARIDFPTGIASDAAGNLYVTDPLNGRIHKITPAGEVSTFADGTGSLFLRSMFDRVQSIAIDAAGHLYVTTLGKHGILMITPAGEVSMLAGGERGFADGFGSGAKFDHPSGITIDATGNLYVADTWNHRIRKLTPEGDVSTLAGGEKGFADGFGSDAKFDFPIGIASDAAGHLYVADSGNHRIRKITPAGEVSTLAGGEEGFADGIGSAAKFHGPFGIANDAAGNLYVADFFNHRIRKVTPAGEVSTLAGSEDGFADGVGSDAKFDAPSGVAIDAAGNLYVADTYNRRIRKIEIRRP